MLHRLDALVGETQAMLDRGCFCDDFRIGPLAVIARIPRQLTGIFFCSQQFLSRCTQKWADHEGHVKGLAAADGFPKDQLPTS